MSEGEQSAGRPAELLQKQGRRILGECYAQAEELLKAGTVSSLAAVLGDAVVADVASLGELQHLGRGVALTLATYKACRPGQDIRMHQAEYSGGFPARGFDTEVTVPFLKSHTLSSAAESAWLTQSFSTCGPLLPDCRFRTSPRKVSELLVEVANAIEAGKTADYAKAVMTLLLVRLIEERNRGDIPLTRPKGLTIEQVIEVLSGHFAGRYAKNAPRLPQLAVYAIYRCLLQSSDRYRALELAPLARLKSADRKAGEVGDVTVLKKGIPFESVEVKLGIPITAEHVGEAIAKITPKRRRK